MRKQSQSGFLSLAEWREANQLTQIEAAAKFGVHQSNWSRLERGEVHPRPALMKRLMKETGVPVEVLAGVA